MDYTSCEKHNIEIQKNLKYWKSKPILRKIYKDFYQLISKYIQNNIYGKVVEVGSGIGNLKMVIPNCISTDIFPNPWIDRVENAYKMSFTDNSISNLILFDVWHHLKFPGTVLREFNRVLVPGGRVIIFEPAISVLGFIVYGLFHNEPIGFFKKIKWNAPKNFSFQKTSYYAAQGNANRVFCSNKFDEFLSDWDIIKIKKISSISYAASGGYSSRQLYPDCFYPSMKLIDKLCDYLPLLFATRLLVIIEKKNKLC